MKFGITRRGNSIGTDIDAFRRNLTHVFDDFFSMEPTGLFDSAWRPALDVEEDEKTITVKAEVPGIDEKNLSVNLERNVLTIAGEKREEKKTGGSGKRQVVTERSFGSFMRSISLPEGVKADNISAEFRNGVLTVTVPKDKADSRRISIDVK